MERLNFRLPDFTRHMWASENARISWEPLINKAIKAQQEIEWLSVAYEIRACALQLITPEGLVDFTDRVSKFGLLAMPIQTIGCSKSPYQSLPVKIQPGQAFNYLCAIGKPEKVQAFKEAWDKKDDNLIGKLHGFPDCCIKFFIDSWIKQGLIDTTWSMALNSINQHSTNELSFSMCEVAGPIELNILLRWLGIRLIPHLPCSFNCKPSLELALKLLEVGDQTGHTDSIKVIQEMLSWPVEWSALHGIAEIKTPLIKISTCTDATKIKYIVRREGTSYPAEGVSGINFPYKTNKPILLTLSHSYRRGIENPIEKPSSSFLEIGVEKEDTIEK
ncbi:MAG: hypothetical protein HY819_21570 [Acidobacteria bacterium]|nr:hypothetical protein [Acidobacteriota bacterium]